MPLVLLRVGCPEALVGPGLEHAPERGLEVGAVPLVDLLDEPEDGMLDREPRVDVALV